MTDLEIDILNVERTSHDRAGRSGEMTVGHVTARVGHFLISRAPVIARTDGTAVIGYPGGRRRGLAWSPHFGERFLQAVKAEADRTGWRIAIPDTPTAHPALPCLTTTNTPAAHPAPPTHY